MSGNSKSILVIGKGDTPYSDRNRVRFFDYAIKSGHDVQQSDYHRLKALRDFRNEKINIMLFFPYTFWNANCEEPQDTRLYGTSRKAYEKFRTHFLETNAELEHKFGEHRLHYLIPPQNAFVDRDKVETIRRLKLQDVPTSQQVNYSSLHDVIDSVAPDRGIFIKCRYGAEGKGITVLRHGRWVTNYKVEGNTLANYGVYDKWQFTDITGRKDLLGQLIENEVIVEKEIVVANVYDGKKFDLRAYAINQDMPHFFVRLNDPKNEVTNYSQGAMIMHHPETGITEKTVGIVTGIALSAARALGLEIAGVDIMFDMGMDNPKVVEMQAFTDFPDIWKFDLVKYIFEKSGLFE